MGGRRAGFVSAIVVSACAFAIGCGSDGADEPSSASPGGTLTARQYAELERMYSAMVPLDKLADNDDARSLRKVTAGTARACRQVDQTDPLLAAMVDGCERTMANMAAFGDFDCSTEQKCNELMASFVATMRDLLDTLHESKPIVEREVGDPACRDALLTPEQTEALKETVDAFDSFAAAARSGNASELESTGAEVEKALAAMDEVPSARAQFQEFRRACRPVES